MRKLFSKAAKTAPCIVFFDELDALGKERSTGGGGRQVCICACTCDVCMVDSFFARGLQEDAAQWMHHQVQVPRTVVQEVLACLCSPRFFSRFAWQCCFYE